MIVQSNASTPRKTRSSVSTLPNSPRKLPPGNTRAGIRARFRQLAETVASRQPRIPPLCEHPARNQLMCFTGGRNDARWFRVVSILTLASQIPRSLLNDSAW